MDYLPVRSILYKYSHCFLSCEIIVISFRPFADGTAQRFDRERRPFHRGHTLPVLWPTNNKTMKLKINISIMVRIGK